MTDPKEYMLLHQRMTVSFFDTVAANSNKTLVSQRISRPFQLFLIRPHFALGTNRTLKLRFYVSPDDSAPTASPLSGTNVLSEAGQVDYVVGDNEYKELFQDFVSTTGSAFLKVYAENTDAFQHTIDVQMFIKLF